MAVAGLILAGLAALVHVYIFVMESLIWTTPRVRATFGVTEEEALATKSMAFNQGFYNLFLAISVFAGIILFAVGAHAVGATLVFVGAGSMAAAAIVLLLSSPDKRGAALKQGVIPAVAVIILALGVTL
ncbi:DUF1304 domain-containing protein [Microbacterium arabinogalactanolyticum]|uniref:DUF1304 domain-containing protein n=1 Tax=Microbacterium arabinogalactanolyticum TaxID=69365 RepID=UPI002552E178|nr:DUF1304 domain-containing protein [Microbacterium arabinogalactanolyticum]GLC85588.1 membrane protein [Microbacterium arabinogalactanolyticum]